MDAIVPKNTRLTKKGEIDKRSITSKYNALKHGKYAQTIALSCDRCMFGKNKTCKDYQPNSICKFKDSIAKVCASETRDIDTVENRLWNVFDQTYQNYMHSLNIANMTGGIPDKIARSEADLLVKLSTAIRDINKEKLTVTKSTLEFDNGELMTMVKAEWQKIRNDRKSAHDSIVNENNAVDTTGEVKDAVSM